MTHKHNGGPAFPRARFSVLQVFGRPENGMSLRDYFAAMAMQGLMPVFWGIESRFESGTELVIRQVETAYEYADAMLEQREKGE